MGVFFQPDKVTSHEGYAMNKSIHRVLGKNKEEVSKKIQKIESSLFAVENKSKDEKGDIVDVLPYPIIDDEKPLIERMLECKVPGLCIAVINEFEIEWIKSYGVKNTNTQEPITLDTIFQAASISKPMVATLALQLVEKNKLDLDEPTNNKLKNWCIPESEFTKTKEITLRHILTHTSGINMPFGGFGREEGSTPTILQTLRGESPAKNDPVKVEFEPESRHQYSNLGFIVIEKLLQDVTGKNLNELAKEMLFEPLGMTNSYFLFPSEELQKQMIYPHNEDGTVF
ncbi:MAG: beta-lactamase family protein [Candidatus Heimdallarchaeota archaeon]|nr:beta-lactamase family protein [Candidatus Heimdallarchaeota archaeon]